MIVFRPLPVMTLCALAALGVLLTLGVWQLERAAEKREMFAAYEATASHPPVSDLTELLCPFSEAAVGREVVPPTDLSETELRFVGAREGAPPGWRVLRLATAPDCAGARVLVVEADFETLEGERLGPPGALVLRVPPRPNAFTPPNDVAREEYYQWDAAAFARAFGVEEDDVLAGAWLAARGDGPPPRLADMPPARHVGYAITWFGIAATLVGVYIAFHVRAGRLRFGSQA